MELGSGLAIGVRGDGAHVGEEAPANLVPDHQEVAAEVGGEAGGGALGAQGSSEEALELSELTLELIGGRGQVWIIEAGEQVRPPATRQSDKVVDKGGGGCAEAGAGDVALEGTKEVPELALCLGAVARSVGAGG